MILSANQVGFSVKNIENALFVWTHNSVNRLKAIYAVM